MLIQCCILYVSLLNICPAKLSFQVIFQFSFTLHHFWKLLPSQCSEWEKEVCVCISSLPAAYRPVCELTRVSNALYIHSAHSAQVDVVHSKNFGFCSLVSSFMVLVMMLSLALICCIHLKAMWLLLVVLLVCWAYFVLLAFIFLAVFWCKVSKICTRSCSFPPEALLFILKVFIFGSARIFFPLPSFCFIIFGNQ